MKDRPLSFRRSRWDKNRHSIEIGVIGSLWPDTAVGRIELPVGNFTVIVIDCFHQVPIHRSLLLEKVIPLVLVDNSLGMCELHDENRAEEDEDERPYESQPIVHALHV